MAGTDGDGGEPQPLKNSAAPSVSDLSSMARSGDPGAMPDTTRSAPPVGASFTTATPPAGTGLPQLVGRGTADHSPAPLGAQSHVSVILGPLGLNSTVATADVRSVAAHTVNAALATADNLSVLIPGGSFAASIAMAARSVGIDLGPWGRKDNDAPAHPVNQGASAQSTATVATNANGESSDALSMASTPIEGEGESLADGSTRLPSSEEDVIASLPVDPEGLYYLSIAHGIHGLKDPTKPVMEEATQVSIPLLLSAAAVALEVNRRLKKHREEGDSEERMLALSAIP